MANSTEARTAILSSIRSALRSSMDAAGIADEYAAIPRTYKRAGTLGRDALLDLFAHRLGEYDAGVSRCSVEKISEEIARILGAHLITRTAK